MEAPVSLVLPQQGGNHLPAPLCSPPEDNQERQAKPFVFSPSPCKQNDQAVPHPLGAVHSLQPFLSPVLPLHKHETWSDLGMTGRRAQPFPSPLFLTKTFFQGFQVSYRARPHLGEQRKITKLSGVPIAIHCISFFHHCTEVQGRGDLYYHHPAAPVEARGPPRAPPAESSSNRCLKGAGHFWRHKKVCLCV